MKRVIACALVVAFCFVAVFTGTVSAAAIGNITYTVVGSGYDAGANNSYVTAVVTFKNTDSHPFVAGVFDLNASDIGLQLTDASVSGHAFAGASELDKPQIKFSISKDRVLFASFTNSTTPDISPLSRIDILLTFAIVEKPLSEYAAGKTWALALSNVDVTDEDENTYDISEDSANSVAIHVHEFAAAPGLSDIETVSCGVTNCDAEKTYVNVEGTLESNTAIPTNFVNVAFKGTGDVVLQALLPKTEADNGTYGIDIDGGDEVYFVYFYGTNGERIDGVATPTVVTVGGVQYYAFPCGSYGGGIGRISSSVKGNFIVKSGGNVSVSYQFKRSILDWVEKIIDNTGYTNAEKTYAKALYDYAKATAVQMKNDGKPDFTGAYTREYYNVEGFTDTDTWTTLNTDNNHKATTNGVDDTGTWNVAGISVTTGFKPSMNIKFRGASKGVKLPDEYSVTIKIKDNGNLVYMKEVGVTNLIDNETFILSDVPTKYLVNDIEISVKESDMIVYYGYGRYTSALTRGDKPDAPVFRYMMDYAARLNAAFPG